MVGVCVCVCVLKEKQMREWLEVRVISQKQNLDIQWLQCQIVIQGNPGWFKEIPIMGFHNPYKSL